MKKFETFTEWTTEFAKEGAFEHLNQMVAFDEWHKWPSPEALESLMPYELANKAGKPIHFIPQAPAQDFSAVAYEEIIYQTGNIPTRSKSWHDLFGALIWCLFPKTKALLNQLHYDDIQQFGKKERTKRRNALTLFDECGVILVSKNKELINALRQHEWKSAFIDQRDCWGQADETGVVAYQFGHANYEMLTKPYDGLTGKFLHIEMSAALCGLPVNVQYRLIDDALHDKIQSGALDNNEQLSPLPLLGVPDWYSGNEDETYYDNVDYFRPKSR
jgi:hypothetical protein